MASFQTGQIVPRLEFLAACSTSERLLEIGPGVNPIFAGQSVEYLDVLDADGLRSRMAEHGYDVSRAVAKVHHVAPDGRLFRAPRNYSFVASCHNIEHQPDLIRHLGEVADRLQPGGSFLLIVPDKRYCFDHFLPESTLADVIGAWLETRALHSAGNVVKYRALTTHNDPRRHWAGDHGEPRYVAGALEAIAEWSANAGKYIDVHAWQFTPSSFRTLMDQLAEAKLSPFSVEFVGDTPANDSEFCAKLVLAR